MALSAFASFCQGAQQGRFPKMADRDDLWRLLVTMTARKAGQHRRHEGRQKRGGNAVLGESAFVSPDGSDVEPPGLDQVVDGEPTPAFAAQVAEECQRLLAALPTVELRSVSQWKMEGDTNAEIAVRLGCIERSVEAQVKGDSHFLEKAGEYPVRAVKWHERGLSGVAIQGQLLSLTIGQMVLVRCA